MKGQWTSPKTIFNDQWKIAGCPVNGPRITAYGKQVAVAWFSAPNDVPQVKIIFSNENNLIKKKFKIMVLPTPTSPYR